MSTDNTLAINNPRLLQLQLAYIFARAMGHRWTDVANGAIEFDELDSILQETLDDTSAAIRSAVLERDPKAWGILAPETGLDSSDTFEHESAGSRVCWSISPRMADISIQRKYSDGNLDVILTLQIFVRDGALDMRLFTYVGCASRHVRKILDIFESIRDTVGLDALSAQQEELRDGFAAAIEYAAEDARQEMRTLLDASVPDYTNPYTGIFPDEAGDPLYAAEMVAKELGSIRARVYHLLNDMAAQPSDRPRRGPRPPRGA